MYNLDARGRVVFANRALGGQALNSEETLRLIIDSIPAMIWTALPDGTRDFINRRWLEFTGLSLQE